MDSQWRIGMSGPTGLDYCALFMRMERLHLSDDEWEHRFADLRAIEAAALKQMREGRDDT